MSAHGDAHGGYPQPRLGQARGRVVEDVRDPIARCSFRNVYSGVLSLHGDYSLALQHGRLLYDDAQAHRLDFVLPVASCTIAQALCGLREYSEAERLL